MTEKPKTDRVRASAAGEFIWDTSGHTEVHNYIREPILKLLCEHGAKTVLDLGCGNGSFSILLNREGFAVTGVDHSLSGIEIATRHSKGLNFRQHDLLEPLSPDFANFDAVISTEVIEHLPLPRKLMENALSALKPGGLFILTTPYHGYWKNLALALAGKFDEHWHPLRDYGHIKFFSRATITDLFTEFGLHDIQFETVGRIPALARSMIISATKSP
jgi:2-polyprenyl-6-hydroxyphenyl methylase/3-demethylubiquinone-9 3-methyltransferase